MSSKKTDGFRLGHRCGKTNLMLTSMGLPTADQLIEAEMLVANGRDGRTEVEIELLDCLERGKITTVELATAYDTELEEFNRMILRKLALPKEMIE